MKKALLFFIFGVSFFSCNKDLVDKPRNLIDKKRMADIFYDIALLDAVRYQDPNSLYKNGINPKNYIFKKYKIDSVQFAKSNAYYASDYREYKNMFDAVSARLKKEKDAVDLINKQAEKKENALRKAKGKKIKDSIAKVKKAKELKIKKEKDSVSKAKKEKELHTKKKDSVTKSKKEKVLKPKK